MQRMQRTLRARTLREGDWEILIGRIKEGKCTPFLGAGACADVLPLASDIANEWADRYKYPLPDHENLIQVAQFLTVEYGDSEFAKRLVKQRIETVTPNFALPDEIHSVLAGLPLPLYITTNYDDYMVQALALKQNKKPVKELCRWNKFIKSKSIFEEEDDFSPSEERPIVFHLHGHTGNLYSMVLTEDDYLDFLINVAADRDSLPSRVVQAFTDTSLLFLGYRLADANFRVVFRSLVGYLQSNFSKAHVSVQLEPEGLSEEQMEKALDYLDSYFKELKVRVYWGACQEFAADLRSRM